jgi:hypothetical protein
LIEELLQQGLFPTPVLLAALPVVVAIILQWLTQHSPLAKRFQARAGVVAPFCVLIGLLFVLFTALLAQDIWNPARKQNLQVSQQREAAVLQNLQQLATALGSNGEQMRESIQQYIEAILMEKQALQKHQALTGDAQQALQQLVTAILNPPFSSRPHLEAAQTAMLENYRELQTARTVRMHTEAYVVDIYKWSAVIVLGLLTQLALALVHIEARRAQAAALTIFTLALIVTLLVLALAERLPAEPALIPLSLIGQ